MYYKGKVNGRYRGWCYQSFSKCSQKYVFNLLIKVEVGSKMSMIGSTFHKQGTLLQK